MKLATVAVLATNIVLWAAGAPTAPRLIAALALAVLAATYVARIRRRSA